MSTLLNRFNNHLSSSNVPVNNHFYSQWDGCSLTACGRCRLASGRWGRMVGLLYGCTERHTFYCISNMCGRARGEYVCGYCQRVVNGEERARWLRQISRVACDASPHLSPEVTLAFFRNELLMSFSTMPYLISSW
jgi:hypothetical protein